MGKPLVNRDKWSQNDIRLLVVFFFTVIYPIFAAAFFALFIFVIMPALSLTKGPHIYWLVAALLWVLLCAVTLPCFQGMKKSGQRIDMDCEEGPVYPTKPHTVQPHLKIEEGDEKQRLSLLTNKSRSSSNSIEKGVCEEKADKESLEKSKETLEKSSASLDKAKITQSGEFLNECMGTLGTDNLQEKEAECQVHAEQENKGGDQSRKHSVTDEEGKEDRSKNDDKEKSEKSDDVPQNNSETRDKDKIMEEENLEKRKVDDEPSEAVEPVIEPNEIRQIEAITVQIEERKVLESSIPEEDETAELDGDKSPVIRRKAIPNIDTSRTSGYYECSMPTPKSAGGDRPESNMVFLYVNPDIAANEEDIIVNHEGEVQKELKDKD